MLILVISEKLTLAEKITSCYKCTHTHLASRHARNPGQLSTCANYDSAQNVALAFFTDWKIHILFSQGLVLVFFTDRKIQILYFHWPSPLCIRNACLYLSLTLLKCEFDKRLEDKKLVLLS